MMLFHVTDRSKINAIKKEGLKTGSYFSTWEKMTSYYAETIEDEEGDPVVLAVDISKLDESCLAPDIMGIEEPIMTVVRSMTGIKSEDDLFEKWDESEQDWNASLTLVGCLKYNSPIDPGLIMEMDPIDYSSATPLVHRPANRRVRSHDDEGMAP